MDNTHKKKIVLTGGGTAGHVSPNIALLPYLKEAGYEVTYIGSKNGIEKNLIADFGHRSLPGYRRCFPVRPPHGETETRRCFLKGRVRQCARGARGGVASHPVCDP